MASAFGGQRSIQLSYGCLSGRLAEAFSSRQPRICFRVSGIPQRGAPVIGWNCPRPQAAPGMLGGECSTWMISTEQSWFTLVA